MKIACTRVHESERTRTLSWYRSLYMASCSRTLSCSSCSATFSSSDVTAPSSRGTGGTGSGPKNAPVPVAMPTSILSPTTNCIRSPNRPFMLRICGEMLVLEDYYAWTNVAEIKTFIFQLVYTNLYKVNCEACYSSLYNSLSTTHSSWNPFHFFGKMFERIVIY